MLRCLLTVCLFTFIIVTASCKSNKLSSKPAEPSPPETASPEKSADESNKQERPSETPAPTTSTNEGEGKLGHDLFVSKDQTGLSYHGYTILRESKTVKNAAMISRPFETPNIRVMKNRKLMGTYIKFRGSPYTIADFGLFNFLGDENKQLIIGETEPRTGRFWIISLFPKYRVLLDTNDYGGSRQEMWVKDVDKDGTYEIKVVTYGCTSIGTTFNLLSTPQPVIIFKYDNKAEKYLPANHLFQSYALQGIEEQIQRLQPTVENPSLTDREALEHGPYFRELTDIFLQYVYAGRENEGWAFFDKFYNLPDRYKVKASIKADLRKDKIYRFIYRQRKYKHN